MNHLKHIIKLNNKYFIMRHGESSANKEGIILSNPEIGVKEYGLTEKGKKQAEQSILKFKQLNNNTIIYSSDFLRTAETSEVVKNILKIEKINFDIKLRERYFGILDKTSNENYKKVWDIDKQNPDHTEFDVESVNNVISRITKLIIELENKYNNKNILLVSHGDPSQMLRSAFLKIDPPEHLKIKHLNTAEIKNLTLKN